MIAYSDRYTYFNRRGIVIYLEALLEVILDSLVRIAISLKLKVERRLLGSNK